MREERETDEVWDLLGRVRTGSPGPFFTAKVLRRVRGEERASASVGAGLIGGLPFGLGRLVFPVMAVVVVVVAVVGFGFFGGDGVGGDRVVSTGVGMERVLLGGNEELAIDYLLLADLDILLVSEEGALWARLSE